MFRLFSNRKILGREHKAMKEYSKKILLINPVTRNNVRVLRSERCQQKVLFNVGIWPPVALLEIATYLKYRGFKNIRIIDGEIENLSFDALLKSVIEKQPCMVVLQVTTPTILDDTEFVSMIKKAIPGVVAVCIGIHGCVFPEQVLKESSFDYVVLGEPEETIPELAEYCFNHKGKISRIQGLAYKNNSCVSINSQRASRENYDYPAMPDRTLLKNELYILPMTGKPFSVIKVSRGCDFDCSFCTSGAYYGKGWRSRSPENIVAEIKNVKEEYGIDTFMFLSDTFNNNRDFVKNLTSLIIEGKLNIKWVCNCRVDLADEDNVRLMKKAGCLLVSLGLESYDEVVLRKNKKYISAGITDKNIALFKESGILTYGYFILGLEGETNRSILKTIIGSFFSKLDFAIFYSLTPYPGTPYFSRFNSMDFSRYFHGISDIVEYPGLSKKVIKLSRYAATILFYSKPRRLKLLAKFLIKKNLC